MGGLLSLGFTTPAILGALALLPERHRLTGQLAMMLVMVGYTFTGLYLLFGG